MKISCPIFAALLETFKDSFRILANFTTMSALRKAINKIFPSEQARRVRPWFRDNGDKTLRLNYDLNENSVVFDLGGYEGQWASDIFSMYLCTVFVFEPFQDYARNIQRRFAKNSKIKVFEFGLGKDDSRSLLYMNDDATSLYGKEGKPHEIEIKKASRFISSQHPGIIDLVKINIEGAEYDLLEELIDHGDITKIKNIQVQFHDFVPEARSRMEKIQASLSRTHRLTYQYEFVWENWELK
jgi:FkbM family methyltransferase